MTRVAVIAQLADLILQVQCPHPLRVAIDRVDAAGKTVLAKGIAEALDVDGPVVVYVGSAAAWQVPETMSSRWPRFRVTVFSMVTVPSVTV